MGWTMAAKMMSVLPRGPMNVTLLPDGVFGDVISLRWAQTELGGPSSNVTRVLIRQEETQKQTRRVESNDSMDTRLGGPQPPAKECLKLPEAREMPPPGAQDRTWSCQQLDFRPPASWAVRIYFCCSKLPTWLWQPRKANTVPLEHSAREERQVLGFVGGVGMTGLCHYGDPHTVCLIPIRQMGRLGMY